MSAGVGERVLAAKKRKRVTIGLRGPFRGAAVDALREMAGVTIDKDVDLVLDLLDVTAIDGEGLAALDSVANFARTEGGSFFVRPPVANKGLSDAVAAVAASPLELARLEHPAGRGG